jgi:hypothetical protein
MNIEKVNVADKPQVLKNIGRPRLLANSISN